MEGNNSLAYLKIQSQIVIYCPLNASTLHMFFNTRYRVARDTPTCPLLSGNLALGCTHQAADLFHRLLYVVQCWLVDEEGSERVVNSRASYLSLTSVTSNK